MSMTDPIADMLTRIRNGSRAGHEKVDIPASKVKLEIIRILKDEGYIRNFKIMEDKKQGLVRVYFKMLPSREKVITDVRRISRPGLRVYVSKEQVPKVLGGLGVAILSTSKGLMADRRARREGVGGEYICSIW
jgi:small subunit ribosomal protein S8